jgi:nitroreductase
MSVKSALRRVADRLFPRALRQEVVVIREALGDAWRYQRATGASNEWSDEKSAAQRHEARLTMDYHRVEKGLALPEPKRPFGKAVAERMTALLAETPAEASEQPYIEYGERALASLGEWNEQGSINVEATPFLTSAPVALDEDNVRAFFGSRHSVRNFDPDNVPTEGELRSIVELARNTPSVCNRQGFRVHMYRSREDIDAILKIQNGATGFAHVVPAVGVVTARRALFVGPDERNQRWVDGGLFAMTLVWAAHARGFATCMLNWSLPSVSSARLRKVADIPEGEDIVVVIAFGHAKEGARVARSQKRSIDDLAWFHP